MGGRFWSINLIWLLLSGERKEKKLIKKGQKHSEGKEAESWFLITDERENVCVFVFEVFLLIEWVLTDRASLSLYLLFTA